MRHSPWRTYFGQMHKKSSKQSEVSRHPVIVALSFISATCLFVAAVGLRFNKWYFGKVSVKPICNDPGYRLPRVRPVIPIDNWVAYLLAFADPLLIVLCIEIIVLVVSLDKNEAQSTDEPKPRRLKGPMLFIFRFMHFIGVHFLTLAFVSVLVDVAKIVFDWHRPYFLKEFPSNCDNEPLTTPSYDEIVARLGFPSHRVALLSSAGVLVTVHAIRSLQQLRSSGPFQALIILGSIIPVIFVAASLINSHENRTADVIVGLLFGAISALYTSSMLPSTIYASDDFEKFSETNTPSTIEELNSVVPMRQAVSWQIPRSPLNGRHNRHSTPVAGYTARSMKMAQVWFSTLIAQSLGMVVLFFRQNPVKEYFDAGVRYNLRKETEMNRTGPSVL